MQVFCLIFWPLKWKFIFLVICFLGDQKITRSVLLMFKTVSFAPSPWTRFDRSRFNFLLMFLRELLAYNRYVSSAKWCIIMYSDTRTFRIKFLLVNLKNKRGVSMDISIGRFIQNLHHWKTSREPFSKILFKCFTWHNMHFQTILHSISICLTFYCHRQGKKFVHVQNIP